LGYLLALALPAGWTEAWIKKFAEGLAADQAAYGISLLGGDTSRAANGLTVVITAFGRLPRGRMVHRAGAQPGDLVYVSGTGGDDYEIIATVAPRQAAAFERAARRTGIGVTRIGHMTKGQGMPVVVDGDGRPLAFGHASFDHFAA